MGRSGCAHRGKVAFASPFVPMSHFLTKIMPSFVARSVLFIAILLGFAVPARGQALQRCEVVPQDGHRASFQVDGIEKTCWHFGRQYERPFLYPFHGPQQSQLTRIGHPGAGNHDHHRSIWFAHHDVAGSDFWSNTSGTQIRQKQWYCYQDGPDQATMAVQLGWYDNQDVELLESDVVVQMTPLSKDEQLVEFQLTVRPAGSAQKVELGKTNFGFLAVRVAKSLSGHFGDGRLTDSKGRVGEKAIFANAAAWMDYSGSVAIGSGADRKRQRQGITYFDHADNPRYPTHWHVRQDGWMGASFCMNDGYTISQSNPLRLRYLLHAHGGDLDTKQAAEIAAAFDQRAAFVIQRSKKPHVHSEVIRVTE